MQLPIDMAVNFGAEGGEPGGLGLQIADATVVAFLGSAGPPKFLGRRIWQQERSSGCRNSLRFITAPEASHGDG